MAQKKQQQKSYIVVYFVIFLVVLILGISGAIFGMVKHAQNKKNPTTKASVTQSEETTKEKKKDKEATAKIQMAGDVLLHQTTAGETVAGAAKAMAGQENADTISPM